MANIASSSEKARNPLEFGDWVFYALWVLFMGTLGMFPSRNEEYFDPHNHLNGILPYEAYANLPSFIDNYPNGPQAIAPSDLRNYYSALSSWEQTTGKGLGNRPYAANQRFGLGARTVLDLVPVTSPDWAIRGALERVLTATPWTEFDNAYAFRGGPTDAYLDHFYKTDQDKESTAVLEAIDLELARTRIMDSEQSMNFTGGWGFRSGVSGRMNTIKFFMNSDKDPVLKSKLSRIPRVGIILMTHAAELGAEEGGMNYDSYSPSGCVPLKLDGYRTEPGEIQEALLGRDAEGGPVLDEEERNAFFRTVVGIDTAGPELECMSEQGMSIFKADALAVYEASRERRRQGWKGKLLVHTHVGEGGSIYRMGRSNFSEAFGDLPKVITSRDEMPQNISRLLGAIDELEKAHPDLLDYVVFRLGHVTWATAAQAQRMAELKVETDVNLESNVATGAYPLDRMPEPSVNLKTFLAPFLADKVKNWELNDLLGTLIPPGTEGDPEKVGEILGNASLKYLLENHVPVLLGTDGAGVEHSDIEREYALAESLVQYWKKHDPDFVSLAPKADRDTFLDAVAWHLKNMGEDKWVPFTR